MSEQPLTGFAADDTVAASEDIDTTDTEETEAPETEILTDEADADTAEDEAEDETPDWAEIELDGQTYQVHPDIKDGYLRYGDYTQKTQEVAEQRKAIEARETQLQDAAQVQMTHLSELAAVQVAQQQVEAFEQVNWDLLYQQDPAEAARLSHQHQMAVNAKTAAEDQFYQSRQTALQSQQGELAKAQEKCREAVTRDIPGWSGDVEKQVRDYALGLGYSEQALAAITDPTDHKTLHKAFLYDQLQAKQRKAKPKLKPEDVATTKVVKAKKSPPKTGLHDNLSTDEWVKRRNRQLAGQA